MNAPVRRELVVVGAGPAGMSAALAAHRAGVPVCLIDEREALGGPLGVQDRGGRRANLSRDLAEAVGASRIETRLGTVAWGLWDRVIAVVREGHDAGLIEAERLIVATGAYERPVVFPGWTLPGVTTPGATLAPGSGEPATRARRTLVAGSGPWLPALAARLHREGTNVVMVTEAAPRPSPRLRAKLRAAARGAGGVLGEVLPSLAYLRRARVPVIHSHGIARAEGDRRVERAVVAGVDRDWRPRPGTERPVAVDVVCVAYGLFPSTELTLLTRAAHVYAEVLGGHVPVHDEWMRTTAPGVLVAGDCAGVAGRLMAAEQGRLAGIAAAMDLGRVSRARAHTLAAPVRHRLERLERLRRLLDGVYGPGPGIYELATPTTVVCPCEDVTVGQVVECLRRGLGDVNAIKSATRAGMGLCQGRSCARQVLALVARHLAKPMSELPGFTPRPPVRPVPLGLIADERPELPRAPVID